MINLTVGDVYIASSGISKEREYFGKGHPFLSFKTVFNSFFLPEKLIDLVESSEKERTSCSIKKGDVFLTRTSETQHELGMSCVALKDYPDATFNGFTKRLRPRYEWKDKIDPMYIGYYFRSPKVRDFISSLSSLTTRASLNNEMIARIPLDIPSLVIQRKIAAALSDFDKKITLNNFMNDNLIEQAKTLFRSSFIEYKDGDKRVGDYIIPTRGKPLLSKNFVAGPFPVVAGGLEAAGYHHQANTSAPVITISASGANAGFVRLWFDHVWASDSSYVDSESSPYVYFWYILLKLRQDEIFDAQIGSAQPHIYPAQIASLPIGELNTSDILKYNEQVKPLFEVIRNNINENKRLAELRDTLLPKLMSGEIDVDAIEL